ncbi:polymorphic repeat outer membrane protein, putative [Trichomonas vaginalis G3]|uniref:Polymorphic repeat outer membrane protein, putative n=1 Tax=Trichomonas vaginalis (strain ATCC PRA-98 / G3) TaxID=412133 RepID=A2EHE1_TRIV3|nr:lipid binding [Trichomonas vaginalis G3]EAY07919.1 polymorphic repeat outer membrane protein, putative [Trichomonas vaginalis G3]KAI5531231.1 lipid binding [Trichomonas vaginalis G3]|eukprot:XP_001320142.1 polymorphic repeat outer membrane protein [Trichomonas vaginalis G3]
MAIAALLFITERSLLGESRQESNVPQHQAPNFISNQYLTYKTDYKWNSIIKITSNDKLEVHNFYYCCITIKGECEFKNNNAFGEYLSITSGGAMFLDHSVITITSNNQGNPINFENNYGLLGGAICCYSCTMLSSSVNFINNTAFKHGGAIYFQCDGSESVQENYDIGCIYLGNTAYCMGGAICMTESTNSYFENSSFFNNKAGNSGGAIYSLGTKYIKLFSCAIQLNNATSNLGNKNFDTNKIPLLEHGRGGGGLCIINTKNLISKFDSQNCCINGNFAKNGITFQNGSSHDVLLFGHINWTSINDHLIVENDKGSIGLVEKDPETKLININIHQLKEEGYVNQICKNVPSYSNMEVSYSYVSIVNEIDNEKHHMFQIQLRSLYMQHRL